MMQQLIKRQLKFLYSFKFINGYIFEVNYLDVGKDSPRNERYQWFLLEKGKDVEKLEFKSMEENKREFQCGSILLMDKLIFNRKGKEEFIIEKGGEDEIFL